MNEELKIVIKALTTDAQKNIAQVRKELDKVGQSGDKSGKSLKQTLATVGKSAAAVVGTITAVSAAMAALGNKAQEVNKGIEKLNTTFKSVGSTSAQATDTYKELFGILGDHDRAIETAQSLARITTEADKLAEYYDILAGSVAKYGDGLNSEAFSEQIAETIAGGKAMGDMARVLVEAGVSEDAFNATLERTVSLEEREAYVRSTLNSILGTTGALYRHNNKATIEYNQSQANVNIQLSRAAAYLTPFLTALNNLSATMLGTFSPALRTITIYLTAFIQIIAEAIAWVGNFFGVMSSKSESAAADVAGYEAAMEAYNKALSDSLSKTGAGIDDNNKKLKELKKQTMGFDELNVISEPIDTSDIGGGGGGEKIEIPPPPDPADYGIGDMGVDFTDFKADLDEAKSKLEGILTLVGLIGAGFVAWKIFNFLADLKSSYDIVKGLSGIDLDEHWNDLTEAEIESVQHLERVKTQMARIGGLILTAVGSMLLLKGYTDAWANGVDWGNITEMIVGLGLAVGGLALAFPGVIAQVSLFGQTLKLTAANIALAAGGIALIVVGIKDFINNGPTLENTILIIGGAIAVAVALATGGLSVLTSLIVGAVVAIGAFTAAIILQKPAIMDTEEAKKKLQEATQNLMSAETDYCNVMDRAEAAQKKLTEAEKAAGISGEELYTQVYNGTLTYSDMTEEQKELYKAYLDNETQQNALEEATKKLTEAKEAEKQASWDNKLAIAKEKDSYDEFKKSVVEAYEQGMLTAEEARDLIEKGMSEMSTTSQKTFMEDLPSDIKDGMDPNRYETVKKKLCDWFSDAGKWITDTFGKYFTKEYWKKKFNGFVEAGKNMINDFIGLLEKGINWIIGKLNKLNFKMPDWLGGHEFGFNIKPISIPRLAKGGIVDSATIAMIGEQGKEAVVPLENNTEWMDKLADRLAQQINTPSKIVLALDGRELGWATINGINGITKQTGALQLRMV